MECPCNGHGLHRGDVRVAVRVTRDGRKGHPTAICPLCKSRVFLPRPKDQHPARTWHEERGFTEEEAVERGLLILS